MKEFEDPIKGIFRVTTDCYFVNGEGSHTESFETHDIRNYLDPKKEYDVFKRKFVNKEEER